MGIRPETAQDQHDEMLAETKKTKLIPKAQMEALLNRKSGTSSHAESSTEFDPIERAMKRHPGLTREEAEEMARDFGF